MYVALWEKSNWLVESSALMGMHPDSNSIRSPADVETLFALWSELSATRKRRGDFLRLAAKSLTRVRDDAVSVRIHDGPAPALDPELYFEPTVPHYPLVSHAWVPSSSV